MICTTAISGIESSLANFKDEIEIEEVAAFQACLQLAIANFAAVDILPTPPKIPSHSRPSKGGRHGLGNEKIAANKVAIAISRSIASLESSLRKTQGTSSLPKIPEKVGSTWATIDRKSKKKARITLSTNASVVSSRKVTKSFTSKDKSPTRDSSKIAVTDRRLFVRLPQEHEWRKLSPAGIREYRGARDYAKCRKWDLLIGSKIRTCYQFAPVIVPTVPANIRKEHGEVEVNKSMLTEEIERVCHTRPAHVKLYGGIKPGAPHRTWMAYFPTAPRTSFRVFDESGIARKFKKQQPLEFCKRCNGHHLTKNYPRAPSCGNCWSTNHTEELCMAATKCRNCGGPHRSNSRRCFARPTRSGAPTKEQLKTYRQAGEREYQAVLRAKAAEELAASTNTNNTELASNQASEVDNEIDNIPASSVDLPTVDAMRL
ncbi:putative eka-like protein [Erysiphe necator]|uniref:Putative eka-like protein n=1 Tax=Uncinula necator TaxID=52586 RepID=A0A0B1P1Z7_UNCNE|nr:putative eka-like protein [Erysiphe necator]